MIKKTITVILKTIKFIPFLWAILINAYCIRVKIKYGACPNSTITDPDFLYPFHQSLIDFSMKYGGYAILIFILFSVLKLFNINYVSNKDIFVLIIAIITFIISLFFPINAGWILGD